MKEGSRLEVRRWGPEAGASMKTVRDIMVPIGEYPVIGDTEPLHKAIKMLHDSFCLDDRLPVMDRGRPVGIVRSIELFQVLGELLK